MKQLYKQIITFWGTVILLGISNIACTKVNHNNIMPADTSVTITDTPHTPVDTMPSPPADTMATTDTTKLRYLALGDSYTIGQSVEEYQRFPAQAVAILSKKGINIAAPQYIATTGWTTTDLQNAIEARQPKGPFDVITLLIGVNDQYRQYPISEYPGRFTRLLETAIALTGNHKERVIVLSIPDYSVTPFGGGSTKIHDEIESYNNINRQITLGKQITYINITDISRMAATDPTLIANDGLHPSAKQYAMWVELLAPAMEKVLK